MFEKEEAAVEALGVCVSLYGMDDTLHPGAMRCAVLCVHTKTACFRCLLFRLR